MYLCDFASFTYDRARQQKSVIAQCLGFRLGRFQSEPVTADHDIRYVLESRITWLGSIGNHTCPAQLHSLSNISWNSTEQTVAFEHFARSFERRRIGGS